MSKVGHRLFLIAVPALVLAACGGSNGAGGTAGHGGAAGGAAGSTAGKGGAAGSSAGTGGAAGTTAGTGGAAGTTADTGGAAGTTAGTGGAAGTAAGTGGAAGTTAGTGGAAGTTAGTGGAAGTTAGTGGAAGTTAGTGGAAGTAAGTGGAAGTTAGTGGAAGTTAGTGGAAGTTAGTGGAAGTTAGTGGAAGTTAGTGGAAGTTAGTGGAAGTTAGTGGAAGTTAGTGGSLGPCEISSQVATHVATLATTGWSAYNKSAGMQMFGCAAGAAPIDCLGSLPAPDATNIGTGRSAIASQHLRVLYSASTSSSYWTRISPDGRFVGRGTHVHDMARGVEINAAGVSYLPAFFPDQSFFAYQPAGEVCPMSVLTTGTPTTITANAAPCTSTSIGLDEQLAASLGGGLYWAASVGSGAYDNGGHTATLDEPPPNAPWLATANTKLTALVYTGSTFSSPPNGTLTTPFQGDGVLSPSATLLLTRVADSSGTNVTGYVLNALAASTSSAGISASIAEIGHYCVLGGTPTFSLDERFVTLHHYVRSADAVEMGFTGPTDPAFAPYLTQGASNVYLLELANGKLTRLTSMAPGQYALYPSFRSDGWIYFLVRTAGSSAEVMVASDAALLP